MAEVKVTQQMINEYRILTGNYVLSDSAIYEKIQRDIETGKLPEEFATLASDSQRSGNDASTNLFGYGFNTESDMGLKFERTTGTENSPRENTITTLTLDDFIKDLGIDANSPEREKILDRFKSIMIIFEIYDIPVDGKELKLVIESNDLEVTFDNISNVMEILYGVTLRNEEELKASEEQRNKIFTQIQAANMMEYFFSLSAQWNDQFTDGLGLFGLGAEGLGWLGSKVGLGKNHFQWADICREWAERAGNLSVLNPEKFQEEFKKVYYDDGKYGIEFNEEKFNDLLKLVQEEKVFGKDGNLTQEGKDAILEAFNFVLENPNASTYNQIMLGAGEALMMIATLGWGAQTKGAQVLATTSMATFSRAGVAIASKSVNNKLLQGVLRFAGNGAKLLGPAVSEGTKLATYTLVTGTAANATNRFVNADSEENSWEKFLQIQHLVGEGTKGSFAFGAFAGIFGSTVTQAVVQRVSKLSSKVTTALADKFAKGAVDANEVYATILAKSVPTGALEKTAVELAAFATDVVGFTAFETALTLVKNLEGFPDDITPEDVANLLWEQFKGQGYNLGQIRIISHLIMWMSGSRGARAASAQYLKENLPQLKGATVEQGANNSYRIKLKNGAVVECKNATEMISSLNLMVRGETALNKKFVDAQKLAEEQAFKEQVVKYGEILGLKPGEEITQESLKKNYRRLAKENHADKGGSDAKMAEINLAQAFFEQNLARINSLVKEFARPEVEQTQVEKSQTTQETKQAEQANTFLPVAVRKALPAHEKAAMDPRTVMMQARQEEIAIREQTIEALCQYYSKDPDYIERCERKLQKQRELFELGMIAKPKSEAEIKKEYALHFLEYDYADEIPCIRKYIEFLTDHGWNYSDVIWNIGKFLEGTVREGFEKSLEHFNVDCEIFTDFQLSKLNEYLREDSYTKSELEFLKQYDWTKVIQKGMLEKISEERVSSDNTWGLKQRLFKDFIFTTEEDLSKVIDQRLEAAQIIRCDYDKKYGIQAMLVKKDFEDLLPDEFLAKLSLREKAYVLCLEMCAKFNRNIDIESYYREIDPAEFIASKVKIEEALTLILNNDEIGYSLQGKLLEELSKTSIEDFIEHFSEIKINCEINLAKEKILESDSDWASNTFAIENVDELIPLLYKIYEHLKEKGYSSVGFASQISSSSYGFKEIIPLINEKTMSSLEVLSKQDKDIYDIFDTGFYSSSLKNFLEISKIFSAEHIVRYAGLISNKKDLLNYDIVSLESKLRLLEKHSESIDFLAEGNTNKIMNLVHRDSENVAYLDEILERFKVSSPEEKEFIKTILQHAINTRDTYLEPLKEVICADSGLTFEQKKTLLSNHRGDIKTTIEKIISEKDKKIDFGSMDSYTKTDESNLKYEDYYQLFESFNLLPEECDKLAKSPLAFVLYQAIQADKIVPGVVGPSLNTKNAILKAYETLEEEFEISEEAFVMYKMLFNYLNKENIEMYIQKNGSFDEDKFMQQIMECGIFVDLKDKFQIIEGLLQRDILRNEINILGEDACFKLQYATEEEIVAAYNNIKELGSIFDESNIIPLLVEAKGLSKIKITPEIKEFACKLSEKGYIDYGTIAGILANVYSPNEQATKMKIEFYEELTDNLSLTKQESQRILKSINSDDVLILSKRIEIINSLEEKVKVNDFITTLAPFMKKLDETGLDVCKDFLEVLQKNVERSYEATPLLTHIHIVKENTVVMEAAKTLLEHGVNLRNVRNIVSEAVDQDKKIIEAVTSSVCKIININPKFEFGMLFSLIIAANIKGVKDINIRKRLQLYDHLLSMKDEDKNVLIEAGLNIDKITEEIINTLDTKRKLVGVPEQSQKDFFSGFIANNDPKMESAFAKFDFAAFGKEGLPLKYSRKDFSEKIESLLEPLSQTEQDIILKHFGLERGVSGFEGIPNNIAFNDVSVSVQAISVAKQICLEIENFTLKNEVLIKDKRMKKCLDSLLKGLPEFTSIVGKEQHGTHIYSVDIHTLKVLQSVMNDPEYKNLRDQEKTVLKFAILLHDLGKKGGIVDKGHAALSSDYAYSLMDRYSFPKTLKDRIIDVIDNHHWFEGYNMGNTTAEEVAAHCRYPENLEVYKLFAKADFSNVSLNFHLGDKSGGAVDKASFEGYMREKFIPVEEAVNKICQKANLIYDTKFTNNGEKFPLEKVTVKGEEVSFRALNLSKIDPNEDLSVYGFAPGTTKDMLRFLVHMTDPNYANLKTVVKLTDSPLAASVWSVSLVKANNNRTYGNAEYGFILEIPQENISTAYYANIGSGTEKSFESFVSRLFGDEVNHRKDNVQEDVRHFVRNNFLKIMEEKGIVLTIEEFGEIARKISRFKHITQIKEDIQINDKVIKAQDLVEALEKSRDALFEGGDIHSEIVALNIKPVALYAKVENISKCNPEFLKFAKEEGLPIILMKPEKEL